MKNEFHQYLNILLEKKDQEPIDFDGRVFGADSSDQRNLERALRRISLPGAKESRSWILQDKSISTVNHDDIKGINAAIDDRYDILHQASYIVHSIIDNSDDPESLDVETLYNEKITELTP